MPLLAAAVPPSYSLEVVAGSNFVGDGGLAIHSPLGDAEGVAFDRAGNIYLADATDNRIRMVAPNGIVSTVYGTGSPGPLTLPYGIATDPTGNLYVADLGNNRILKISPDGTAVTALDHLASPRNVLLDAAGNLYFSEFGANKVSRLAPNGLVTVVAGNGLSGADGDGGLATLARLNAPAGLALDSAGNLYIADSGNHKIRRISNGRINTVFGTGFPGIAAVNQLYLPTAIAIDSIGNLYVADSGNRRIRKLSVQGAVTTIAGAARDLIIAADGSLLGASGSQAIRILNSGVLTTIAGDGTYNLRGDGGPANQARINQPAGVAFDPGGILYIADTANSCIRTVDPKGIIQTISSGVTIAPAGLSLTPTGDLLIADISAHRIRDLPASLTPMYTAAGNGSPGAATDGLPAIASSLYLPAAVAADSGGAFYFADTGNHRIRRVYSSGVTFTVAGNGTAGFNGDGSGQGSQLKSPGAIALDSLGNLWIADTGNNRIRKLALNGSITTVAGPDQLNQPRGLAVDSSGNLWIADTGNHRILLLQPGGTLVIVKDQLLQPVGIALDKSTGSVYFADQGSNRIYRLFLPPAALTETPPQITVVNAATLLAGSVAPGSLISIFGAGLANAQALFDNQPVPLLSVQDSQLNLQVPLATSGLFELRSATATLLKTTLTLVPSAPGIFTVPGGTGQVIAANQDASLNSASSAAASGDVVTFYATGIGTLTSLAVTISGTPATILFAGDAPGMVAITQINTLLPPGLAFGPQPLLLQNGIAQSQAGVTIQIR